MTTKRKIKILEGAKELIKKLSEEKGREGRGLCYAVDKQLTVVEGNKYYSYSSLEFLGIKEPKSTQSCGIYWFPLSKVGDKKRIKIINEAIKKLKTKRIK